MARTTKMPGHPAQTAEGRAEGVQHPVTRSTAPGGTGSADDRQRAEQRHQNVAAGLLAVPDKDRGDGREHRRHRGGAAVVELAGQPCHCRDERDPGEERGEPHGGIAVAEDVNHQPHQDGVQRRVRAVVVQARDQLSEGHPGLVDIAHLVDGEPAGHRQADRDSYGSQYDHGGGRRGAPHLALEGKLGSRAPLERERLAGRGRAPTARAAEKSSRAFGRCAGGHCVQDAAICRQVTGSVRPVPSSAAGCSATRIDNQ